MTDHSNRTVFSLICGVVFLALAVGSYDDAPEPEVERLGDTREPSEVRGVINSREWAKNLCPEIADKIRELDEASSLATQRCQRLNHLCEQFPSESNKFSEQINEWDTASNRLTYCYDSLYRQLTDAYTDYQANGGDPKPSVEQIFQEWAPQADDAIAFVQELETKHDQRFPE